MQDTIDYATCSFVADQLNKYPPFECRIQAEARKGENFDVDDIAISASSDCFQTFSFYPLENKSIKGNYNFFEDGDWRMYFKKDIYDKFRYFSHATGTPIYFINGTDINGNYDNGKYSKILKKNGCLSFLAGDAILLFSPKRLAEAFLGYAEYQVRHREEIGNDKKRNWEVKAVLDLTKAYVLPCSTPKDLLRKNNCNNRK